MVTGASKKLLVWLCLVPILASAFVGVGSRTQQLPNLVSRTKLNAEPFDYENVPLSEQIPKLSTTIPNLDTIALVAGQENYGLAIVLLGEGIWSFAKAPSVDHGLKTLLPAGVAAVVLCVVSGPMITSGNPASVSTGLWIATGVSAAMGAGFLARCFAQYSPSPKEIPALGFLVALAGFFSFSQNLIVDGFVTLPSIPLPSLPTIELPF